MLVEEEKDLLNPYLRLFLRMDGLLKQILLKIKALRGAKGLSQKDIAEKMAMTRENYINYESGRVQMTIARLVQIAEILGVQPVYFFVDESVALQALEDTKEFLEGKINEIKGYGGGVL